MVPCTPGFFGLREGVWRRAGAAFLDGRRHPYGRSLDAGCGRDRRVLASLVAGRHGPGVEFLDGASREIVVSVNEIVVSSTPGTQTARPCAPMPASPAAEAGAYPGWRTPVGVTVAAHFGGVEVATLIFTTTLSFEEAAGVDRPGTAAPSVWPPQPRMPTAAPAGHPLDWMKWPASIATR
jgi:hypothetical protein